MSQTRGKNLVFAFFSIFIFLAVCIALLLEYIDYKKGKESIIFARTSIIDSISKPQEDFNKALINFFNLNQVTYSFTEKDGTFRFKVKINPKIEKLLIAKINQLVEDVKGVFTLAEEEIKTSEIIKLYKIKLERKISHWLLVSNQKEPKLKLKKTIAQQSGPQLAFIIDDIGNNPQISKVLNRLNIPITGSILPHSPFALEEAEHLKAYKLEALIHIPMQPKNSESRYPRDRYITIDSSNNEIRSLIKRAKAVIPNALGCNNHEGSLVTSNPSLMKRILKIIQDEGLFFVDSRTTVSTVAFKMAKELKVKTSRRDVFLDDPKTYENSMDEIKRLVDLALRNGKALAIGHPFESTLQAIQDSIPYIRSRGVKIVFASQLLE